MSVDEREPVAEGTHTMNGMGVEEVLPNTPSVCEPIVVDAHIAIREHRATVQLSWDI